MARPTPIQQKAEGSAPFAPRNPRGKYQRRKARMSVVGVLGF